MVIFFVAAAARILLDAPPILPYSGAAGALAFLAFLKVRHWFRSRAYRRAHGVTAPIAEWMPCDAVIALDAHTVAHCAGQKDHEGPHNGTPEIEWRG